MSKEENQEKNNQLFGIIFDSFRLSQGDVTLQIKMLAWLLNKKLLILESDELPHKIYTRLAAPERHVVSGQKKIENIDDFKDIFDKLMSDPETKKRGLEKALKDFQKETPQDTTTLIQINDLIKAIYEKHEKSLSRDERVALATITKDLDRKTQLVQLWDFLRENKGTIKTLSSKEEEQSLYEILKSLIFVDLAYVQKGRKRPAQTESVKPDGENDPYASYTRKYFVSNEKPSTKAMEALVDSLKKLWTNRAQDLSQYSALQQLINDWEKKHPGSKFF